jgi:hypothetical protein
MKAAIIPPPEYAGLVGCAALGGLLTLSSPRCYAQAGVGCRGFLCRLCGYVFMAE